MLILFKDFNMMITLPIIVDEVMQFFPKTGRRSELKLRAGRSILGS
jgi:DNA helicase HerA-like ATPase